MRKIRNSLFALFLAALVLILSAQNSSACSCSVNDTVDKDFVQTPNIVILKAQSVEKLADGELNLGNYGGIKQTVLTVEKVFKGNLKVGQELIFAQGTGADCVWTFTEKSVGENYLFYLGDKPIDDKSSGKMIASTVRGDLSVSKGIWAGSTCSRSGSVDYAAADLKYLENISKVRGKTRLSGLLNQYISVATEENEAKSNLLADFKIKISGGGKNIELKTDENGVYEIYDLPPGKYKITPEKIVGYKALYEKKDSTEVEVKAKNHTEQNFYYQINNRVSGKLYDTNGKPLKDVCLHLIPARGKKTQYFYQGDCTEADGSFEFDKIPAGNYVIVVNEENEITATEPFGMFYYPNAVKREEAAEINVDAGDFVDNLIINTPQTAEIVTISGVLLFENGKPANDESVEFYSEETIIKQKNEKYKSEDSRASTDKNGRFTIRILKGKKGKLLGSMITYEGEYENCPKLDKLIRAKGDSVEDIETPSIEVDAISDLTGVVLKFPFPACKKAKIE